MSLVLTMTSRWAPHKEVLSLRGKLAVAILEVEVQHSPP